ncbi:S8 family serine peptidase [Mongoliitalea daihaiensis]|uniref:S8 family serine peptidase n=1 Tax=Mongoliitalea daihaiensis TaxID=2782006 RepID=UPI001F44A24F|nr:S8 family serine peptidase [Mongoliitalea daihaiensis]UJP63927.1 S8 family serine peptidase [Mongoliitalea daihaiensis]
MNTKILQSIAGFFLLGIMIACSSDPMDELMVEESTSKELNLMTKQQIDQVILESLRTKGDFLWMEQSVELIYSALVLSDSTLTIGYKPASLDNANSRLGVDDLSDPAWVNASEQIKSTVLDVMIAQKSPRLRTNEELFQVNEFLPYIEVKVDALEVLKRLKNMGELRYMEPLSYQFNYELLNTVQEDARIVSSKGCSNDPEVNLPASDFSVISPNAKSSWNYPYMGINNAWSLSTGSGITVGVIDTGLSPSQPMMNNSFNSGASSGRTVEKFGTYQTGSWWWKRYDGPDDQCGHGTAMAGVIASPRNSVGNAVGVAYNSNLISVRGTEDVVIDSGNEKDGVSEALVLLGNRSDVRIISMSIGDVFSNSKVADAIRFAHNRGKLIFAAAGTSTSWTNWFGVIFPANMAETVAVTGIKEAAFYQRCDTCHSGSMVDFTVIMERGGTNNHPLTTANYSNDPAMVGGSSVATATAAGIAALVWARNPNWNRTQVLQRMASTAHLFPNRNSQFGWGLLNAAAAVQ